MEYISIILLGVILSIDAFSFAVAYGMQKVDTKKVFTASLIVGIFHFLMTFLGRNTGDIAHLYLYINPKFILMIVLLVITFEVYKSDYSYQKALELNTLNTILFSFLVSFDSFTAGLGLKHLSSNTILACLLIAVIVFFITLLGFKLGNLIYDKAKKNQKILTIIILQILIIYTICK